MKNHVVEIIAVIVLIFSIVVFVITSIGNEVDDTEKKNTTNVTEEMAIEYLKKNPNNKIGEYFINDAGSLVNENFGVINSIHTIGHDVSNDGRTIRSDKTAKVFFNSKTRTLTNYVFGETKTFCVDEGYEFCGYSNPMIGYLFRKGTEIFAINEEFDTITKIAEGVEFIIDCQYDLGNEYTSQPLFLMIDGSILSYIQNIGLQPLIHEGGSTGRMINN